MDEFKLSTDDTMRHLRSIAQAPGELQWRLELLSTLERMRVTAEVTSSSILQNQRKMHETLEHLTPTRIAKLVNAQIEEKMKPRDEEVGRLWKASIWLLEKAATIAIGVACTLLGLKAMS